MLYVISFAAVTVVSAVAYLACVLKRKLRERRGREESQRCEDSKNMILRLQEAFSADGLVNLAGDQSSQFS